MTVLFETLKAAGKLVDPFVPVEHQGPMASKIHEIEQSPKTPTVKTIKDYEEVHMARTSYPTSHKNETRFGLDKLNEGICELDPHRNTILHLVSEFGDVGYTKSILEKHSSLIECRNSDEETPLYVAAKNGHMDILDILINCVQHDDLKLEQLATRSKYKHTALHIAIENHHPGVVFLLVKEIPKLANCINSINESPLYLAMQRRHLDIFRLLLDECSEIAIEGPNDGSIFRLLLDEFTKIAIEVSNDGTILHLTKAHEDFKSVLEKHSYLIHHRNSEGETPLYVAARKGHVDVLEMLINYVKHDELILELATRTKDQQTALHVAIGNHDYEVVRLLVKDIPKLANCINSYNESPINLAVERKCSDIFKLLLRECTEIAFEGINGTNALHTAVLIDAVYVQDLLCVNRDLLRNHCNYGWTPLHYAVFYDNLDATKALLEADSNIGYEKRKSNEKICSAIHLAVSQGHHDQIGVLFNICPECLKDTDSEGRNILHVAIEAKRLRTYYFILDEYGSVTIELRNQKDCNGKTPLNLLADFNYEGDLPKVDQHRANLYALDSRFLTPIDKEKELAKKVKEEVKREKKQVEDKKKQTVTKIGDNVVLVVTLIATATFAAAFTVPGGFDGNEGSSTQGMPILLRKTLYKVFVVSNALAFSCSCCVLFAHVRLQLYNLAYEELKEEDKDGYVNIINLQYLLTGMAMIAMAVAFITGTYVILTPSLALAISLCATCVCIIMSFSLFPAKRLGFATRLVSMFTKSVNNVRY